MIFYTLDIRDLLRQEFRMKASDEVFDEDMQGDLDYLIDTVVNDLWEPSQFLKDICKLVEDYNFDCGGGFLAEEILNRISPIFKWDELEAIFMVQVEDMLGKQTYDLLNTSQIAIEKLAQAWATENLDTVELDGVEYYYHRD